MALTGFGFRFGTSGASPMAQLQPDLALMDRRSIDLNKHAFDLNEDALDLNKMGMHSSGAPNAVEAHTFTKLNFGFFDGSAWPPRTGGWLELFQDMFEQEKHRRNFAQRRNYFRDISASSSRSCEQTFQHIPQQTFHHIPEQGKSSRNHMPQLDKSSRSCEQTFHEQGKSSRSFGQTFHHMPQQEKGSTSGEQTFHRIPELGKSIRHCEQTFHHMPQQEKINRSYEQTLHHIPEQGKSSRICEQTFHHIPVQEKSSRICEQNFYHIPEQEKSSRSCMDYVLEEGKCDGAQPISEAAAKPQEPLIKIIKSPDWLPVGWITELKTRKAGSTAGTKDKYYKDPVSGHRFRSRNEVISYLRTGRVSRYKPKVQLSEGTASATDMTRFLPMNEVRSCIDRPSHDAGGQLNPSGYVGFRMLRPDSATGLGTNCIATCKPGPLPEAPVWLSRALPEVPVWLCRTSHNSTLEKVFVKEESERPVSDSVVSQRATEVVHVPSQLEGLWKLPERKDGLEVRKESGADLSKLDLNSRHNYREPVGKVHESIKQELSDEPLEFSLVHSYPGVSGVDEKNRQNIVYSSADLAWPKAEAGVLYTGNEVRASLTHSFKDARNAGQILQVADVRSPCSRSGEIQQGKRHWNNKMGARKVQKLAPRLGKDLLVSLGRKLCWQALGLSDEDIFHQLKNQDQIP